MKTSLLLKKLNELSVKNRVKVALFAAELVLPIYESHHPDDKRVRKAIESGKQCAAANAAYAAAYAAANAAYAAANAAYAAVNAAAAAANANAAAATYATYAAANAAAAAYAVKRAVLVGARKKTIYEYMCRLDG